MLRVYSTNDTLNALPFPALIEQMRDLYAAGVTTPDRHSHTIPLREEADETLLLMPGWHEDIGCVKIVNVVPDNGQRDLPAVAASVLVFHRKTGEHLAILDGDAVTVRRTAAASALAADYLAPVSARKLLIIGSGKIAEQLAPAFCSVRPIEEVMIWNRRAAGAEKLAETYRQAGFAATAVNDLAAAVHEADIISAATLSTEPLIRGEWLRGNQHIDLIGSFTPTMREADNEVFRRAAIYVDTPFTARESGEIAIPLAEGAISPADILGDLYQLTASGVQSTDKQHTVFKGAGNAVMDLAAAMTVMRK